MDALFAHVEQLHAGLPWGEVLDAGTGSHSLAWIRALRTKRWVAVTADPGLPGRMDVPLRSGDRVVVGDWADPGLLAGEGFDTVIADYLLGAIDGFAPYFQEALFERLRPHVRGRLYVIGLEPWPASGSTPAEQAFVDLVRLRDATFLLSGTRPYREYPLSWVEATLARSGFRVEHRRSFAIRHSEKTIGRELGNVRRYAQRLDPLLAAGIRARADALERACGPLAGNAFGADWVVAASPGERG